MCCASREVGLGLFTLDPSLLEDGAGVSCIAERDGLTRRAPQPWFDHRSSSRSGILASPVVLLIGWWKR